MIGWEDKYPARDMGNGKVRSVGMAMSMQGSGISGVDVGSADIKLNEDGIYTLAIGAADMGTGCDTILAQMVAECMMCPIENVIVSGADTDTSPYDSGSYASSTTYITGRAVEKACRKLQERIVQEAAKILNCESEELEFAGDSVKRLVPVKKFLLPRSVPVPCAEVSMPWKLWKTAVHRCPRLRLWQVW